MSFTGECIEPAQTFAFGWMS